MAFFRIEKRFSDKSGVNQTLPRIKHEFTLFNDTLRSFTVKFRVYHA
jgi:hypothetical protein